ncbi:hypothetical protein D3C86_1730650 [compost metagenome]
MSPLLGSVGLVGLLGSTVEVEPDPEPPPKVLTSPLPVGAGVCSLGQRRLISEVYSEPSDLGWISAF